MTKRFKGGPIFLNSGGTGPDDYLVKPIGGGHWVQVIRRTGRHFTGDKAAAERDRAAWASILPLEHVCTSDNRRRFPPHAGAGGCGCSAYSPILPSPLSSVGSGSVGAVSWITMLVSPVGAAVRVAEGWLPALRGIVRAGQPSGAARTWLA